MNFLIFLVSLLADTSIRPLVSSYYVSTLSVLQWRLLLKAFFNTCLCYQVSSGYVKYNHQQLFFIFIIL